MRAIVSFFTSARQWQLCFKNWELRKKVFATLFPESKYQMVRGLVINGRWTVGDRLGAGSFGQVHIGTDSLTNEKVAIKMENRFANDQTLYFERKVYKKLGLGGKFFPEILYYGTMGDYNVMVMQILGPSLEDLFHMCGRKFSLKTITMIAIQMIKRLRHIHKSDYIHRDIKPDNICIGTNTLDGTLFPVDFGLAKRFKDSDRRHMDIKTGKGMMGTVRYASLHAHDGIELSRRDDLEALAYVLAYFIRGRLPWQGFDLPDKHEKYKRVHEEKLKWSTVQLFKDAPKQFIEYFNYIETLGFKDKPDYDKLENLFNSVMVEKGYKYDLVFDWMTNARYKKVKPTRFPRPPPIVPKPPAMPAEKKKRKTKTQKKREKQAAGIPIVMKSKYIPKAVRERLGLTCKHVPRGTTLAALQENAMQKREQKDDAKAVPKPDQNEQNDDVMPGADQPGQENNADAMSGVEHHEHKDDADVVPKADQPEQQDNADAMSVEDQPEQKDGVDAVPKTDQPEQKDDAEPDKPKQKDADAVSRTYQPEQKVDSDAMSVVDESDQKDAMPEKDQPEPEPGPEPKSEADVVAKPNQCELKENQP